MRERLTSWAKSSAAVRHAGRLADRVVPSPNRICTVLTFHRLETHQPDLYPGLAGPDAASFTTFMDELADVFVPIGVELLVAALADGAELPARSVLVTFDDAYRDFAEVAWPVMRERGIPALLFVPTSYPDAPERQFWWDELYGAIAAATPTDWSRVGLEGATPGDAFKSVRDRIKSQPHHDAVATVRDLVTELRWAVTEPTAPPAGRVLGWAELEHLGSEGVALAPHSRTHPMLDQLDAGELDGEIRGSLDDMGARLGRDRVAPVFAYPSGGHDPSVRAAVERAGFAAAFTTERGLVDVVRSDPARLPRLNIGRDASVASVRTEAAARRLAGLRSATLRRPG